MKLNWIRAHLTSDKIVSGYGDCWDVCSSNNVRNRTTRCLFVVRNHSLDFAAVNLDLMSLVSCVVQKHEKWNRQNRKHTKLDSLINQFTSCCVRPLIIFNVNNCQSQTHSSHSLSHIIVCAQFHISNPNDFEWYRWNCKSMCSYQVEKEKKTILFEKKFLREKLFCVVSSSYQERFPRNGEKENKEWLKKYW